jgi:hypothetical protein
MTQQSDETIDVLRQVWDDQGQTVAAIDEACDAGTKKICRNAVHMTFEGYAEDGGDVQSAWKAKLAAEGKLSTKGGSLRDLILGPEDKS